MVVRDGNGHFLLLKRSMSSKWYSGKWDFPGGKVEQYENFSEALLREVFEETGLRVVIHRIAGVAESEMPNIKVVHLIMEGQIEAGELCLNMEHDDYSWIGPEELIGMDLVEHLKPFAIKYCQMKNPIHVS